MNNISYTGEHLWLGQVGHFAIILGFVAALLSGYAYFVSTKNRNDGALSQSWKLIGRYSFIVHGVMILSLIGLLFFAMYNHYYEYSYVYAHVSADLPLKYILSAFWEGQEGSFLLWMFWHIILSIFVVKTSGKYEAPVMFIFAIAQAILVSMILGIHIPWGEDAIRIGSNPTTLLRQMNDAPIFANADYLSLIKGRGLNPLLQNYWMTIHPPTLFLGFASTIVPFAYAFAGLWLNEHKEWLKQSLYWSLFSASILGTGILLGSLWAYVALSFGGYWAWDPVENASLVPWIIMIAGIHVHLVSQNTGYSRRSVYFYYLLSFVMILYSTYLTRSGVLGDTSAHAFTEMGLESQLIFLVVFFAVLGFGMLLYRMKEIKNPAKEEELPSREFWMFMGALILFFSGTLITISTSLPVYNKIVSYFNPAHEGRVIKDAVEHFNKYQLWIAVFISLLSGMTMFLRFGARNWEMQKKKIVIRIPIFIALSLLFTWISSMIISYYSWQYWVLGTAGFFSIISNLDYIILKAKDKFRMSWAALAHLGFGMLILGTITSGLNQKHISTNPFVFKEIFSENDVKKYVQLIKGQPLFSQGYLITYQSDSLVERERFYKINFQKLNDSMEIIETFDLYPHSVYENDFSKVAAFNPDTKHYFNKDIFTCVVSLPPTLMSLEEARNVEDSIKYTTRSLSLNDTIQVEGLVIKVDSVSFNPSNPDYKNHTHDAGIEVVLSVHDTETNKNYKLYPAIGLEEALLYNYPAAVIEAGVRIKLGEKMLEKYFTPDEQLDYQDFTIKNGDSFDYKGYTIKLNGFDKDPKHPNYEKVDGDLALSAQLTIDGEASHEDADPIYVIRNSQPMSVKSYSPITGLHIRFSNIDPEKEVFSFKVAMDNRSSSSAELSIATDIPRNDYVILQATIFPAINLFWVGSILMVVGLMMGAINRYLKSVK